MEARGREQENALRGRLQTTQSQIAGKPRAIHHRRHNPTVTVTSLSESKGDGKRGGLSGDCATSRHHALWSSVYTEMHVNDELLREGGDRRGEAKLC